MDEHELEHREKKHSKGKTVPQEEITVGKRGVFDGVKDHLSNNA